MTRIFFFSFNLLITLLTYVPIRIECNQAVIEYVINVPLLADESLIIANTTLQYVLGTFQTIGASSHT